jgi:hypothetical protein
MSTTAVTYCFLRRGFEAQGKSTSSISLLLRALRRRTPLMLNSFSSERLVRAKQKPYNPKKQAMAAIHDPMKMKSSSLPSLPSLPTSFSSSSTLTLAKSTSNPKRSSFDTRMTCGSSGRGCLVKDPCHDHHLHATNIKTKNTMTMAAAPAAVPVDIWTPEQLVLDDERASKTDPSQIEAHRFLLESLPSGLKEPLEKCLFAAAIRVYVPPTIDYDLLDTPPERDMSKPTRQDNEAAQPQEHPWAVLSNHANPHFLAYMRLPTSSLLKVQRCSIHVFKRLPRTHASRKTRRRSCVDL